MRILACAGKFIGGRTALSRKGEIGDEKPGLALCHQVAGFTAGQAIILTVVAEADIVPALADDAEAFALATRLIPVALGADEGHAPRVAPFFAGLK